MSRPKARHVKQSKIQARKGINDFKNIIAVKKIKWGEIKDDAVSSFFTCRGKHNVGMVTLRWEKYTAKQTKSLGICIHADWANIDGVFHTIDDAKIAAQESVNSIVLASIEYLEDDAIG